ncbi:MAG: NAD(P)-dependent glycerol-3-phosphate dehydrogenase [Proteobacteria bacterium]|nr:NAD(P)-dependent glycerol-3-phosphate dehydrogenase [Pseudomonadota bacterium]
MLENKTKLKIGVIGAGAWGTAFSMHLVRKGYKVLLWVFERELYEILKRERINRYYLEGFSLPAQIDFTDNLSELADYSDDIVIATPSFALQETLEKVSCPLLNKNILLLTKGFETETLLRMSEVVEKCLGRRNTRIAVLSGPSFAKEVALGAFTSVVVASKHSKLSSYFQKHMHDDNFRIYTSKDIVGVELGGAMKNVMAIGAGIIEGLALGTNTQAAFITRALAEIKRLGKALGAKETTFMGLSGIGDLMLTSYGQLSRNRMFGVELSKGKRPEDIIKSQNTVVEGYYTIKAAYRLSKTLNIEMPITEELHKVVFEGKSLQTSLKDIKSRALKEEDI